MTMKSWRQNTNLLKVGGNCPPPILIGWDWDAPLTQQGMNYHRQMNFICHFKPDVSCASYHLKISSQKTAN